MILRALAIFLCVATAHDFSACVKFYEKRVKIIQQHIAVPIFFENENFFVTFSKIPIIAEEVLVRDDFTGLHLLNFTTPLRGYTLKNIDEMSATLKMAAIFRDENENFAARTGQILKNQRGFLSYGNFSAKAPENAVISNICYQIYGIFSDAGFISRPFIERFLHQATGKNPKIYYGDIGVRLRENIVTQIDPFFPQNAFETGDEILKIGEKSVQNHDEINLIIADLPENLPINITIRRKNSTQILNVMPRARVGGLLRQDSFFEQLGIKINENLIIVRNNFSGSSAAKDLLRGDEILWINGLDPRKMRGSNIFENTRRALSDAIQKDGFIELLVSRNGFEFRVKIAQNSPDPENEKILGDELILLREKTRN